jgi:hypothetical protein
MSTQEFLNRMREVEKTASFGTAAKGFGGKVLGVAENGAAAGLGATLVTGIGLAAAKTWDAITKHQDFNSMIGSDLNQDVKAHYQADPTRVNQMFTTLRTMNPQFSKDPLVAGSYLRRMLDAPHAAGGVATEALTHRDAFPSHGMDAFTHGVQEGGKAHITESIRNQYAQPNFEREFAQRGEQNNVQNWQSAMGHVQRDQQFGKQHQQREDQFSQDYHQRKDQFSARMGLDQDRAVMEARAPFYPPTDKDGNDRLEVSGVQVPGRRKFINKYKK